MKLEMEPIPEYNWHQSLAHLLPKPVWDTLRRQVYSRAYYACEICGVTDVRVNCHEVWQYDDRKHIQKLIGFQCLCDDCHNIKHWGRTVALFHKGEFSEDYLEQLKKHFCKVNNCTLDKFELHWFEVHSKWNTRNKRRYKLDFGKYHPERVIKVWRRQQNQKR